MHRANCRVTLTVTLHPHCRGRISDALCDSPELPHGGWHGCFPATGHRYSRLSVAGCRERRGPYSASHVRPPLAGQPSRQAARARCEGRSGTHLCSGDCRHIPSPIRNRGTARRTPFGKGCARGRLLASWEERSQGPSPCKRIRPDRIDWHHRSNRLVVACPYQKCCISNH